MTHVTSRLTAKNRDQIRNPTLGNRVWATFLGLGVVQGAGKMFGILSQLNAVQSSSERDSDATAWSASCAVQCAAVPSVPDYDSSISAAVRFAPAAAADENRLLSIRFARRTRGARFFYMIRFVACVMDGVDDAQ